MIIARSTSQTTSCNALPSLFPDAAPLRLIQYLGSKYRILPQLVPFLKQYTPSNGVFFDLFAGTTCVAQAMLDHGKVVTNDSMLYSKYFGDVLVVGPCPGDLPLCRVDTILQSETYVNNSEYLSSLYEPFLAEEDALLKSSDADALCNFCHRLPTLWRVSPGEGAHQLLSFLSELRTSLTKRSLAHQPACLFTTYYAGTYFGLRQAIEIDSFRAAIASLEHKQLLSPWQAKAYLCALMAALSAAVSSAGKHFAQPILVLGATRKKSFAKRRCLSDRQISITDRVAHVITLLNSHKYPEYQNNRSVMYRFEDIDRCFVQQGRTHVYLKHSLGVAGVDCIYADPPYTAQQYSRFYHILETLCLYDYPTIQTGRTGAFTSGLYRTERHYSPFCRITKAPQAFYSLFKFAKQLNATLLLSYSESRNPTGNRRMVTPRQLSEIAAALNLSMQCFDLDHAYKPLNRQAVRVNGAKEIEQLYVLRSSL